MENTSRQPIDYKNKSKETIELHEISDNFKFLTASKLTI